MVVVGPRSSAAANPLPPEKGERARRKEIKNDFIVFIGNSMHMPAASGQDSRLGPSACLHWGDSLSGFTPRT